MENAEPHRQAGRGVPIRKKPVTYVTGFFGPSVEIRTQGLLNPIHAKHFEPQRFAALLCAICMQ